jgi:cysteine desulfurase
MQYPDPKYFDYAASCPPYQEALKAYTDMSIRYFANPSSSHRHGVVAQKEMLSLKKEFCDLVHFFDGRLLLCSSGTEANNTIIEGHMRRHPNARLLIAEDVHDCIWYATEKYKNRTEILPIDHHGRINIEILKKLLKNDITLLCLNHVSHELGTIHPVSAIADICSFQNVKLLIDGVQAIGKIPVDLSAISCDYYSLSSHKFGGPRSAGGVFIRDGEFEPMHAGGKQEWNLRAGTENLAGLAASLTALKLCLENLDTETVRLRRLRNYLLDGISRLVPEVLINGTAENLPGLISLSFPGHSSHEIIAGLSLSGFALSAGSACHANQIESSRIIKAIGRNRKAGIGTLRISTGYGTTYESINSLLLNLVKFIRNKS